jgi:DNA-binding response OmpR family regulator
MDMESQSQAVPILLFDIAPEFRAFAKSTLESQGFRVLEALTSDDVREMIRRNEAALVIFSVSENSVELLSWAKQNFPAFPVIMTAGAAHPVGLQNGFAVLLEPVQSEELLSTVHLLLHGV